jgi:hypothetical protein
MGSVMIDVKLNEETMLKVFKGVTNFYANGTVYITDRNRVQKFKKHNYEIENLKNDGDDFWITSGVVVALPAHCQKGDAINQLKRVVKKNGSRV